MIVLHIDEPFEEEVQSDWLEKSALAALEAGQSPPGEVDLTIVVTSDQQLRSLNQQFVGIDAPTDVLSFPSDETDPDTERPYLGDILLSLPRAKEQALAGGHPLQAEVQLLVVHGVLHLLGYDHAEPEEKAAMWTTQAEILSKLGSSLTTPPE